MTASERHRQHALSFGDFAAGYERGRPSYPAAAVDWLLPPGCRRVADVGAGTGKLTRLLRARGLDVTAVEPSPGMREQLARQVPDVPVLPGTAEQIPLPDGSVDAVLLAQAWHWAEPARALPEAARVLVPGGWLGLLWNVRDEQVPWVAELGRIMQAHRDPPHDYAPPLGPPFGPPERFTVRWVNQLTPDALLDMVASRSYVITLPPQARTALLGQVRRLLATHPDLAGATGIPLPYLTRCTRASAPGGPAIGNGGRSG
ncbi:MAG: class I SAM-dependent methyltransferase [Actinobacteria bacterium]|nr:class I SAM-dependent methyltransferase [Actinomycetota bacterium]MBO0819092.1 class I SAM-dependent methyltransferase [Actinomycetota bacterium]